MPLLVMAVAFTLLFLTLHLAAMRNEILRRRVRTLRLLQAQIAPGASVMHRSRPARRFHRRGLCASPLLVVLALIAWVALDHRAQTRTLAELEAQRRHPPLRRRPRAPT